MDQVEFDRFADEYHNQHRANVAVTGEGPEYFAEYKIRKLRQAVDRNNIGVSERSLALSKQRYPDSTNYLLIENDRVPSAADAFDVVFSACVFRHIAHEEHAMSLQELHRRLATTGRAIRCAGA
jgi:predicted SAM-dependent methyltransferase